MDCTSLQSRVAYARKISDGRLNESSVVPKFSEIRLQPCPWPPTKKILVEMLAQILIGKKKALYLDNKHLPKRVLAVIGTKALQESR